MREDVKAKQDVFLDIFGRVGTIRGAIRVLDGVAGRRTVYDWLTNDLYQMSLHENDRGEVTAREQANCT